MSSISAQFTFPNVPASPRMIPPRERYYLALPVTKSYERQSRPEMVTDALSWEGAWPPAIDFIA